MLAPLPSLLMPWPLGKVNTGHSKVLGLGLSFDLQMPSMVQIKMLGTHGVEQTSCHQQGSMEKNSPRRKTHLLRIHIQQDMDHLCTQVKKSHSWKVPESCLAIHVSFQIWCKPTFPGKWKKNCPYFCLRGNVCCCFQIKLASWSQCQGSNTGEISG